MATTAKKKKPPRKGVAPAPDPAAVRTAVALWYASAKAAVADLYDVSWALVKAAKDPASPVHGLLDARLVAEFAVAIQRADSAITTLAPRIPADPDAHYRLDDLLGGAT